MTGDVYNDPHNHIFSLVSGVIDETADVTSVKSSFTPDRMLEDVDNIQLSQTLAGSVININPSHANSITQGEYNATGVIINVQPSHISDGGIVGTNPSKYDDKLWTHVRTSELSLFKKDAIIEN